MRIERLEKLTAKLRDLAAKAKKSSQASVIVGYTAAYALAIHENVEMKWKGVQRDPRLRSPGTLGGPKTKHLANPRDRAYNPKGLFWDPPGIGQAKFLEEPARRLKRELGKIVADHMKSKHTMAQALLMAGLRLQRESQMLVPVDTGTLRASAFTRLESGGE